LGNGGITSYDEAINKIKKYKLDGIMVAQGALGNPWLFKNENPAPACKIKNRFGTNQSLQENVWGE